MPHLSVLWIQTQHLEEGFKILHWQEGEWYELTPENIELAMEE